MTTPPTIRTIDQRSFRRVLARNVLLPLGAGLLGAVAFVGLILYLLNALSSVEHTDRSISQIQEVSALSADLESGLRGYVISGDERYLAPYESARAKIRPLLSQLTQNLADNPPQVERIGSVAALQDAWLGFAGEVIAGAGRADGSQQALMRSGKGKQLTDEIRREMRDALATEQRLLQERTTRARHLSALTIGGYLLFSLSFGGLLAWSGRRELLRLSSAYDEMLKRQAATAAKLAEQAWLREGQSLLAEQLIGDPSLPAVGERVLTFLAGRLGSVVGAFYVREDGGTLRRTASYGFDAGHAAIEHAIDDAQTLVGRAAREKRVIRIEPVPPDYVRVTSALGSSTPQAVVIVPIERDGRVAGIVELGFLRPLAERDIDFMEMVSPSIGSSVEAARFRQRLQDVLSETQQLNEALQVQQEELRTTNEELEEQSRILRESQAILETQQLDLQHSNQRLEEQADALDQRNAALGDARVQLEERANELQRASSYKSEFLANMSHELRTPLNSALILSKLLADNSAGNLNAEQVKFAESIYSAGNDLLNLINDILDISKVEAGKLEVRPQDVGIARLVESLRTTVEPLAGQKQLRLEMSLAPGLPASLRTDRQRVEQILKNLLSNAVKFTDTGGVALRISAGADGQLLFAVSDSGIGIPADQQEGIFEAFRQADGTTSRRYGGTGLGLTISRDLAVLLGGTLGVQSTPGAGSTFTLVLPAGFEAAAPSEPAPSTVSSTATVRRAGPAPIGTVRNPAPPPRAVGLVPPPAFEDDRNALETGRRTVLVVEDETKFAHILFDLAHEMNYRCVVAHGAEDGFNLALQQSPHAILLDIGLPDQPGLTLLQRLKENPQTRHIPVHVISAEDRTEAALHLGAIGYSTKPTTRQQLKDIFRKLEEKLTQKVQRVLVVEDDALQRESIARLISDEDVEITAVERGEQALALLQDTIYDCMIIDLTLPDMNGKELLQRMASDQAFSFPPVIVYTGRNLTHDEETELLRYSHSIIIKGARSPERLLDEVTLFLHRVESKLSSERQSMLKAARNRDKVFEGRRILVVDDDVRNIFALTSALEHKGASVEVGRNGREALERLAAVSDIDMVLMDVMMPEMDGLEATRRIRLNPAWQKLPIIAVTAKAMKDDQEQCLKAGTNDYLAKPIELDRLFALMRVWMPKMERTTP